MKIKFIKGFLKDEIREGESKYFETLVRHGIAVEVKEEKQKPETKELKFKPKTKRRKRNV